LQKGHIPFLRTGTCPGIDVLAHVLLAEPVSTSPEHALGGRDRMAAHRCEKARIHTGEVPALQPPSATAVATIAASPVS
jgi:hypothetical protein